MVVICPKCEGEGKVLIQESEMCPKCRGLGLIKLVVGGGKPTNKDICTNCKGTGKIFKKIVKDCSECKGSGKISKTCLLCDNEIENGLLYCNNCLENPYVYQVVLPASKNTIEFNKTYMAKVVKVVDFGYFVAIAPNLEGLIRSKDHKEKVGNNIYVKLKNIKGEKLE
ncbi:zinc finger domain-containing protein, partial [Candidatus Hodarchaeum mangrovi]